MMYLLFNKQKMDFFPGLDDYPKSEKGECVVSRFSGSARGEGGKGQWIPTNIHPNHAFHVDFSRLIY